MIINKFEKRLFDLIDQMDSGEIKKTIEKYFLNYKVYDYNDLEGKMLFEHDLLKDCKVYNEYYEEDEHGSVSFYIDSEDLEDNCPFIFSLFEIDKLNTLEEILWIRTIYILVFKINNDFEDVIRKAKKIYEQHCYLKDLVKESESTGKTKRRI